MPSGPSFASALSEPLSRSRAVQVLGRSLAKGRLAHAILLCGDHAPALRETALGLAGRLLETPDPEKHPDFYTLSPVSKSRQIRVAGEEGKAEPNTMRWLLGQLQLTAQRGNRKVAVIYEADRMNDHAANAFLKTLEEPPPGTVLLLLTSTPYDLLPTIRSRCFLFRLPGQTISNSHPDWLAWLQDYSAWIGRVHGFSPARKEIPDLFFSANGLIVRMAGLLDRLRDEAWAAQKVQAGAGLDEETLEALQTGLRKGIRRQLLADLASQTMQYSITAGRTGPFPAATLVRVNGELERINGLLEVNLREDAALELFFLQSLRWWMADKRPPRA